MRQPIITWDLGGTKCAVGLMLFDDHRQEYLLEKKCTLAIREYTSLEALILKMQELLDFDFAKACRIQIGAAGCFDGEALHLVEGYPYPMPFLQLAKKYHWPSFDIVHDYLPVACATYTSYMHDTANIKMLNDLTMTKMPREGRRVAVGVGTGLGLKDVMWLANETLAYGANEMGHIGITMPPSVNYDEFKRHQALVEFLYAKKQALTFEKILSGRGTLLLYDFLYPGSLSHSPESLGEKIRNKEAEDVLALFAWYLGLYIGTVQLSFMPTGGIWLTGGVILKHLEALERSDFWRGIEASTAYLEVREKFPLGVLLNPEHALYGGAFLARQLSRP